MKENEEITLRRVIKKNSHNEKALQKLDGNVLERLRRATELENPYKIKTDKRRELDQAKYESSLKNIIRQDYYPDLEYMSKNKNDHDTIKTIINNPPGTLNMNDFNTFDYQDNNAKSFTYKKSPNITEFQSRYTHKGHLTLLDLTNQDKISRREKESWIEEQSFKHNLKREINISKMQETTFSDIIPFDEKSLILNKSQARSNFMFPNYNHNQSSKDIISFQGREKIINPRNTRYNYIDDFEKDERMLILKEMQKKAKEISKDETQNSGFLFSDKRKTSTNLLMKSPLIKNAFKRSQKSVILLDHQLRDSYSYKSKSKQSLSRLT